MEIGIIKTSDRQRHLSTFPYHTSFSFKQDLQLSVTILISNSTFLTGWDNRPYQKSPWRIGTGTKTEQNGRPLNRSSNPSMDAMKHIGKYQGIYHRHRKIHGFLCYRRESLGIRPSFPFF